ncbi:MAG: aminoacyl-tRNA hydrolase [Deltaproteobacteria bacterium]|nr:aminoacyl-tRNA hydrolase [Deltaproteobacteria bacterium]
MRFIVGLGNPGLAYRVTRHNVGFMVVDQVARKHLISLSRRRFGARYGEGSILGKRVVLAKPQTYMNRSGLAVGKLQEIFGFSTEDLIVVHDDLDLDFGWIRIRTRGGHGGHKGVQSVMDILGRSDFVRLKVGIGRPETKDEVTDYVLHPFDEEQKRSLSFVLAKAGEAIEAILLHGVEGAMNLFNKAPTFEEKGR